MPDSFIYQPHVYESVGVITPDLLIDRASLVRASDMRAFALPIHLISTSTSYQQVGSTAGGSAALVLIAAGSGPLVSVGSAHHDPEMGLHSPSIPYHVCAKPLSRMAVRVGDFVTDLPSWYLETARCHARGQDIIASTAVADISGISDVLDRWADRDPLDRAMLFIVPGHQDPSPELATGYAISLINARTGVRLDLRYDIHHLVQ